ncbi:MAG: penicillin-binding protein activator [Gammaproteobacteria bacterium]
MQKPALAGRLLIAMLLVVFSSGCQSGDPLAASAIPVEERLQRADALVADATGATADQRLLSAAQLYNSAQAHAKAEDALTRIDAKTLARSQRGNFLVALVDARLGGGNVEGAWRAIARPPEGHYGFVDDLDPADVARVADRRATVLERRGQVAAAARERAATNAAFPATQRAANEDALWALLMRVGREPLRQLEADGNAEVRGWAALARLGREGVDNPGLLAARIDAWMQEHPGHPAAQRPPAAIRQARGARTEAGPAQIAVLLPRHGKFASAGTAIERGILTGWFLARGNGGDVPALRFYDSSQSDFNSLYDSAIRDGAQVVLGPLEKENLKLLQERGKLPVVTIALNYPDAPAGAQVAATGPASLYFFGLAPEDEARQVASAAIAAGHRRGVALVPAGEWGERMANELAHAMQAGGGQLRAVGTYQGNGDYNEVVRNALEIAVSDLRHARIQRLTGLELGFTPKRRQDIDCLFIIGNTLQGTQLVPAVQYQHGGDLALYSTSQINGQPTPTSARDLAGIRFVEMPWIADPGQPVRQRSDAAWRDTDERYLRLLAMGIDAWKLGVQLPLLSQTGEIGGMTGALSLDPQRRVHRRLDWMLYRNGKVEPLDDAP